MIFSSKKEFASYFEGRIFGIYFSFKTTFHKQVLYSSKTLNKLSCHHLFVPTQPYPRFAYFRPKSGTAEPERFSRAGRKTLVPLSLPHTCNLYGPGRFRPQGVLPCVNLRHVLLTK